MEKVMIIYQFKFYGSLNEDNPKDYHARKRTVNIAANNEDQAFARFKEIVPGDYDNYEFKSMEKVQNILVYDS